jgi:hypothetical protein
LLDIKAYLQRNDHVIALQLLRKLSILPRMEEDAFTLSAFDKAKVLNDTCGCCQVLNTNSEVSF